MERLQRELRNNITTYRKVSGKIEGKTIITSDHGNAFGEYGLFGHPAGYHIQALVKVPWLEANFKKRKKIQEGVIKDSGTRDAYNLKKRLSDLGYR